MAVSFIACLTAFTVIGSALALTKSYDSSLIVSQKGKSFRPNALNIFRDDQITILNDDGSVIHHVYIENDRYAFESNDVEPGSKIVIPFPIRGDFMVLCGIHPKMKLAVHVE